MQDDEDRCKEVSTYIHSFWKDLHVKSGCLCVDQRVAIPNSIKEAVLESIHMTHPGSWGMISLSQYAWWPYMHREILAKTSDCAPCTDIGKNLKPIIPKSKWHPHKACQEPNEEIQIAFGGPIINDKDKDIYFLTCIDRYSKYPTVRIFENANGVNVVKFLRDYAYTHGIPRTIRLDQATCLVGKQVTNYCNENNIDILDAPVGDHRAIGLVERMIQTIKRRLACMKAENKDTFSTAKAIKQIVSDIRLTKQKTTKITPFEAHFGRPANTPLRNISTLPSSENLTYEKIVNHYLDAETVSPEDLLDENGWISANRSDTEIEHKMCQASLDAGQRYRESDIKESRFITHPQITDPIPRTEQPLISIVPAPPTPTPQVPPAQTQDDQTKGRKRNRPQFYGFTDADISPTSSLASTSSTQPKKRKNKKDKKQTKKSDSVVALIQTAEQSRIPSPPRPDLQLGQVSPPDPRVRYFEYEQEREMSVWDAENEI